MSVEERHDRPDSCIISGIIYISRIPPKMNVSDVREYFSTYGQVGHVFLQPVKPTLTSTIKEGTSGGGHAGGRRRAKRRTPYKYGEGWVEFADRKIAKRVARSLNNQPVGWRKKRKQFADVLWNIKYLSKFQWAHLSERVAYERAVREQRIRAEVARAKRGTSAYEDTVQRGKARKYAQERSGNTHPTQGTAQGRAKRKKTKTERLVKATPVDVTLLHNIFGNEASASNR